MGRQTSDPMGEVVFLATSYSTLEITAVLAIVRLYQRLKCDLSYLLHTYRADFCKCLQTYGKKKHVSLMNTFLPCG